MMLEYRDAPLVSRSQESTRCADLRTDQTEGKEDDGAIMANFERPEQVFPGSISQESGW